MVVHACTYLLSSVVNPRCLGAADLDEAERAADRTGAAGQQLSWVQSTCAAIVAPQFAADRFIATLSFNPAGTREGGFDSLGVNSGSSQVFIAIRDSAVTVR